MLTLSFRSRLSLSALLSHTNVLSYHRDIQYIHYVNICFIDNTMRNFLLKKASIDQLRLNHLICFNRRKMYN